MSNKNTEYFTFQVEATAAAVTEALQNIVEEKVEEVTKPEELDSAAVLGNLAIEVKAEQVISLQKRSIIVGGNTIIVTNENRELCVLPACKVSPKTRDLSGVSTGCKQSSFMNRF